MILNRKGLIHIKIYQLLLKMGDLGIFMILTQAFKSLDCHDVENPTQVGFCFMKVCTKLTVMLSL